MLDERFEALRLELLASPLLLVTRSERPNSNTEQIVIGVGVFRTYDKHWIATLFQYLDQRFSVLPVLQGCHLERTAPRRRLPRWSLKGFMTWRRGRSFRSCGSRNPTTLLCGCLGAGGHVPAFLF